MKVILTKNQLKKLDEKFVTNWKEQEFIFIWNNVKASHVIVKFLEWEYTVKQDKSKWKDILSFKTKWDTIKDIKARYNAYFKKDDKALKTKEEKRKKEMMSKWKTLSTFLTSYF